MKNPNGKELLDTNSDSLSISPADKESLGEYFEKLPIEIIREILYCLSPKDLAEVIPFLNKAFKKLANDERLWDFKVEQHFPGMKKNLKLIPTASKFLFFMEKDKVLTFSSRRRKLFSVVKRDDPGQIPAASKFLFFLEGDKVYEELSSRQQRIFSAVKENDPGQVPAENFSLQDVERREIRDSYYGLSILEWAQQKRHHGVLNRFYELAQTKMPELNQLDEGDNNLLMWAVRFLKDGTELKRLIDSGYDVKKMNKHKRTALGYAMDIGHFDAINILVTAIKRLEKSADINETDIDGNNLLMVAIKFGRDKTEIESWIKMGCDINKKNNSHLTPMLLAVRYKHYAAIEILREKGVDINQVNFFGETTLSVAVDINDEKMVEFLFKNGAIVYPPILDKATVNLYTLELRTPLLHLAISRQKDAIVKLLLENGAKVDEIYDSRTPLYKSIELRNFNITKLLIDYNAKVDLMCYGTTPLGLAARISCVENEGVVRALVKAKANISNVTKDDLVTLLRVAVADGNINLFNSIIDLNVDIDQKGSDGLAALHIAAQCGNAAMVKLLLDRGANVNAYTEKPSIQKNNVTATSTDLPQEQQTALELAQKKGHKEVVEVIVAFMQSRYMIP